MDLVEEPHPLISFTPGYQSSDKFLGQGPDDDLGYYGERRGGFETGREGRS